MWNENWSVIQAGSGTFGIVNEISISFSQKQQQELLSSKKRQAPTFLIHLKINSNFWMNELINQLMNQVFLERLSRR